MKTRRRVWLGRLFAFCLGGLAMIFGVVLMGAASDQKNTTLSFGRYQLSSWATQLSDNSGVVGAFVLDTVSGETRTVYIRTYGNPPDSRAVKNDLKKPFISID